MQGFSLPQPGPQASGVTDHAVAMLSSPCPSSYCRFPCPCAVPHPTLKLTLMWVMYISPQHGSLWSFAFIIRIPQTSSSLRGTVTPSSPTPSSISRSPQSGLRCLTTSRNLRSALTVSTTDPLPPSASGTLVVLMVPRGTHHLPQHPLTHTNPVTARRTYLKTPFKKLPALTFKRENPFVSASCFGC